MRILTPVLFPGLLFAFIAFVIFRELERTRPCYDACERDGMVYAHLFENHCFCREATPIMPLVEIDL